MTTAYQDDHPGTSLDHLRAAVAHLTRALGLAMHEGRDKDTRHATREARDRAHEAIEALTRQARESARVECVACGELTRKDGRGVAATVCSECRAELRAESDAQRAEDLAEWLSTGRAP